VSAKPDTWMPLVIGDYLKDTSRLTTEQHGAYLLLIMAYWTDGPPPDEDDELASITRLGAREWKRQRAKLVRFFRVEDGVWRHKRVDQELDRWAEKKAQYIARAAAGGRAKAAKSTRGGASSMLEEAKTLAPQPASREVRTPNGVHTLSDEGSSFLGPSEVRQAFVAELGEAWCRSYLDHCGWQDVPERALIPATATAGRKIVNEARPVLKKLSLSVLERAA